MNEGRRTPGMSAVVICATATGALCLIGIGRRSLWRDESASVAFTELSGGDLISALTGAGDVNSGPYHALLWGWARVVGADEGALRSMSVLAAVVAVVVFHLVARRFVTGPLAVVATAAFASNGQLITEAQDVRMYSWTALAASLTVLAFLRCLEEPGNAARWATYAVVAAGGVYMHIYVAFVVAGLALTGLVCGNARRTLLTHVGFGVLVLPFLVFASRSPQDISWISRPGPVTLLRVVAAWAGDWGWAGAAGIVPFLLAGTIVAGRRLRSDPAIVALLAWLIVPVALAVVYSWTVDPVLRPKYLIVSLPAAVIVGAMGLELLRGTPRVLAGLALVALAVIGGLSANRRGPIEDWRQAAADVDAAERPGDVVIFAAPFAHQAFERYADDVDAVRPDTRSLDETLGAARAREGRVWLVLSRATNERADGDKLRAELGRQRELVSAEHYAGVDVVLFATP